MQDFLDSDYGSIKVGTSEAIYVAMADAINDARHSVGLSGGSTPKAFYNWAAEVRRVEPMAEKRLTWSVSDERCVPLYSDESNFGNAERGFLGPRGIDEANWMPAPVELEPEAAASAWNDGWAKRFSPDYCFDLCFLGMGDDCHTASLFPGSPLIGSGIKDNFAAVEVPGKGWRLTITEAGLGRCAAICVVVAGAGKAEALKAVMQGDFDPQQRPIQLLKANAPRVTWLCDEAAVALLDS